METMDKLPMTLDGYSSLESELRRLKTQERPQIIRAIAAAREHGDLSENAEYHAARERQAFVEGRVGDIEDWIRRAEVIDVSKLKGKVVKFGATVRVADEETDEKKTYRIVGEHESGMVFANLSCSALAARTIKRSPSLEIAVSVPGESSLPSSSMRSLPEAFCSG